MDKLQAVKQESKSDVLQTEAMPQSDVPLYTLCQWPLSSGRREGQPCEKKAFDGNKYCDAHQIMAVRKGLVEEKKEPVTVNIVTRASEQHIPMINVAEVQPMQAAPPLPVAQPTYYQPVAQPPPVQQPMPSMEVLAIIKNFSIAIVNLTDMLKK